MSQPNEVVVDRTRRRFLIGLGITGGAAAFGIWRLAEKQTPDYKSPAYESWATKNKGELSDAEYMILCAGLAPSPHNTQPWHFAHDAQGIKVFADKNRNLGKADPEFRQMQLGMGCALYNVEMAARYLGYEPQLRLATEDHFKNDGLVAYIDLQKSSKAITDEEFSSIFSRSTNRAKYDLQTPVSDDVRQSIASEWSGVSVKLFDASSTSGQHVVRNLRVAVRNRVKDDEHYFDAIKWWRYTRAELVSKRDGISIHTSAAPFFVKEGMEDFVNQEMWAGDFGRKGEINWIDEVSAATPVWGVIYANDDSLKSRLHSGMMLEKAYIKATQYGYHINPIDYPVEDQDSRARLTEALNLNHSSQILSVFRLGKGVELEKSVRRNVKEIIV